MLAPNMYLSVNLLHGKCTSYPKTVTVMTPCDLEMFVATECPWNKIFRLSSRQCCCNSHWRSTIGWDNKWLSLLIPRWPVWVWPAAGQVCAGFVSKWRDVSGAFRGRIPLRVSCRRLRASILHSHCPILPTKVLRHVPGPQTEVSPVHLVNVSRLSELDFFFCYLPCFLFYQLPSLAFQQHSDRDP